MEKLTICTLTTCLLLNFLPLYGNDKVEEKLPAQSTLFPVEIMTSEFRAKLIIYRLYELKAIDKTLLNRSEIKLLRLEIRALKKSLQQVFSELNLTADSAIMVELMLLF